MAQQARVERAEPVPDVAVARRLAAPAPTWTADFDVVVVGTGVAGLTTARDLAAGGRRVAVVTKGTVTEGSTTWAQGGVAVAIGIGDSVEEHLRDTLTAGAGLCDRRAVRILVTEGPRVLARLIEQGARFDTDAHGALVFTREGGHGRPRVVHAGGDATGAEIQRALEGAVAAAPIRFFEHTFALDLLRTADGSAAGLRVARLAADGRCREVGDLLAPAVVLATGGAGQLYAATSNPDVSTGDGVALALRAGAELADVEFVQFHPTVFYQGPGAHGRQLLISEAVRGEGGVLVDATGARVMAGVHPMADLAPRDVVALAITRRMATAPRGVSDHVFLDATRLGEQRLLGRFPHIVAGCRAAGVDPVTQPIPVAPAAHYSCGGVRADMDGGTSVPGLFAAGEVACTGVHGANRLASNSLVEGLVVGTRLAARLTGNLPPRRTPVPPEAPAVLVDPEDRVEISTAMSRDAAVLRTPGGLADAAQVLAKVAPDEAAPGVPAGRAAFEATNLHTLAQVLVAAAERRTESRGCHFRADHPAPDDAWRRHVVSRLSADGELLQELCR